MLRGLRSYRSAVTSPTALYIGEREGRPDHYLRHHSRQRCPVIVKFRPRSRWKACADLASTGFGCHPTNAQTARGRGKCVYLAPQALADYESQPVICAKLKCVLANFFRTSPILWPPRRRSGSRSSWQDYWRSGNAFVLFSWSRTCCTSLWPHRKS